MHKTVILLGGNIGSVKEIFAQAIIMLEAKVGKKLQASSLYSSPAWGFEHESDFLNQVVVFETSHSPHVILAYCLETEQLLGRERKGGQGYQARTIDIDILFYDSEIINTNALTIPHPHIQDRRFTLEPLCEIMENFKHPLMQKTCVELLSICKDTSSVLRKE